MPKKLILLAIFMTSLSAGAHCPASFAPEKLCLMLDHNIIYIYDHKAEHNGPYKDFVSSKLLGGKSKQSSLNISRIAKGVYKIESAEILKSVELEVENAKKKTVIKLLEHS
ncbi:MAG: hypothetical protein Q7U04_06190 [Bacteriovorax sp.]|nr:hypothetical protein [Bacteriovorax sp.]